MTVASRVACAATTLVSRAVHYTLCCYALYSVLLCTMLCAAVHYALCCYALCPCALLTVLCIALLTVLSFSAVPCRIRIHISIGVVQHVISTAAQVGWAYVASAAVPHPVTLCLSILDSVPHTHTITHSHTLVAVMKFKERKTKISHAHSLFLSQLWFYNIFIYVDNNSDCM